MKTLRTLLTGWFDGRFSKRIVPLICLSIPLLATGQPLRLLTSTPSDGAVGIPLQATVTFTFDAAIDTSRILPTENAPRYVVFPADRVQASAPRFSADFTTMIFDVTHAPDTDVTWVFLSLHAADGSPLQRIEVVRYTTAGSLPATTVSGRLTTELQDADYDLAIVMLLTDLDWMDQDGGPDQAFVTGGVVAPGTDAYTIPYVRPGTYYLAAFVFEGDSPVALGIHKGLDDEGKAVIVGGESQSGLDIHLQGMDNGQVDPVDALVAWDLVRTVVLSERPDAIAVDLEGHSPYFPPDGLSEEWTVVYFTTSDSLVHFNRTRGTRIHERMTIPYFDIPPEERPDVLPQDFKPIPSNAIGSVQAFTVALANGLEDQLQVFPGGQHGQPRVDYSLTSFPEVFPPYTSSQSAPFWVVRYEMWMPDSTRFWHYLIDAATGTYLGRSYRAEGNGFVIPFEFMGSNPSDMSSGVPLQTTLEFTFTLPVRMGSLNMFRSLDVIPRPQVLSVQLSQDQRTIRMDVTHNPDTDYTWFLPDVRSVYGTPLTRMPVIRYSTRSDMSPYSIYGGIQQGSVPPSQEPSNGHVQTLVVLFRSPDYLLSDKQDPPNDAVGAGTVMSGGGDWVVHNVRPGTYYPGVFVLTYQPDGRVDMLAYGFLDTGKGQPAPIHVSDRSVFGVQLTLRPPDEPIVKVGVTDLYETARVEVRTGFPAARFIVAWGREPFNLPEMPTGKSEEWMFIFYDESTEMVDQLQLDAHRIRERVRYPLSDIPEEERVDPATITFLPDAFIRSENALRTAMDNGLHALIQEAPVGAWSQVGYQLCGFYDRYPDHLTAASNPYWEVKYNLEVRNQAGDLTRETEAFFVIDAITGGYVTKTVTTDAESGPALPSDIELLPNAPNPFNPSTVVRWRLAGEDRTRLTVFDLLGREVAVLMDGRMSAGEHSIRFNASHLPSGMYILVLDSGGQRRHRTIMLVK